MTHVQILCKGCPPLALSYDADAPRATRAELAASLQVLSARLAATIDDSLEREN
jgi:hypothetical protein